MDKIDKLKSFLLMNPQDSFLQHALALEYIKVGEDGEARLLFEAILASDPQYIGSYYHLAKLLERTGETDEAIKIYEQGMVACRIAGDNHAYNELQGAFENVAF
ncbi:MAG: tetratricopeptide repeat protein [Chitinophagaceae bacterium]